MHLTQGYLVITDSNARTGTPAPPRSTGPPLRGELDVPPVSAGPAVLADPVPVERITVRDADNGSVEQVLGSQSGGFLYCSLKEPEREAATSPIFGPGPFHLELVAQDSSGNRVRLTAEGVTLRNRMGAMLVYALPIFTILSSEQPACPRCGRMLTFTPRRRHEPAGSEDRWLCRSSGAAFFADDVSRMQQGGYDVNHRMPDARNDH